MSENVSSINTFPEESTMGEFVEHRPAKLLSNEVVYLSILRNLR